MSGRPTLLKDIGSFLSSPSNKKTCAQRYFFEIFFLKDLYLTPIIIGLREIAGFHCAPSVFVKSVPVETRHSPSGNPIFPSTFLAETRSFWPVIPWKPDLFGGPSVVMASNFF
jgi:hypothetical protein